MQGGGFGWWRSLFSQDSYEKDSKRKESTMTMRDAVGKEMEVLSSLYAALQGMGRQGSQSLKRVDGTIKAGQNATSINSPQTAQNFKIPVV